ncbi:MAG: LysM peptidoglycan-binding domain-containing protein [Clostridia bacterium]|nr:LysM peptidoglycan-binding domain-containing protein [Clostridia bacterium]
MSETTSAAQQPACAYTYTVKRGDSFYLIARRLGVPLRDLMNANADIHPSRLMVGDVLCIPSCADTPAQEPETPAPETPSASCPADRRHVVQANETAADIQLQHNKSLHTLEAANPTLDLENLKAGDTVCVPNVNLPCALPGSVVMAAGDTLDSLASRYRLSVGQLLRANPCLAPDDFVQGTTVKLPQ